MPDTFYDASDLWTSTSDDYWYPLNMITVSPMNPIIQSIGDKKILQPIDILAKNAIFQEISEKFETILQIPTYDYFVDSSDIWANTEDDFWFPVDVIPVYAKNAIFQNISKKIKLQPVDILVIDAFIQCIAKSGLDITTKEYVDIICKAVFFKLISTRIDLPFGSIAWAYGEDVPDGYVKRHFGGGYYLGPFEPGWDGTGQIIGSVGTEHLAIDRGEYMDSPPWNVGFGRARLNLEKYSRKSLKLPNTVRYRTGITKTACQNALWNSLNDNGVLDSLGYVQLRLGSTTGGETEGAFYDHGGFDWADDGGFDWE